MNRILAENGVAVTVDELRNALAHLPPATPVTAIYDAGCTEGAVLSIEVADEVRLIVD